MISRETVDHWCESLKLADHFEKQVCVNSARRHSPTIQRRIDSMADLLAIGYALGVTPQINERTFSSAGSREITYNGVRFFAFERGENNGRSSSDIRR